MIEKDLLILRAFSRNSLTKLGYDVTCFYELLNSPLYVERKKCTEKLVFYCFLAQLCEHVHRVALRLSFHSSVTFIAQFNVQTSNSLPFASHNDISSDFHEIITLSYYNKKFFFRISSFFKGSEGGGSTTTNSVIF